jgi:hypothetical protein
MAISVYSWRSATWAIGMGLAVGLTACSSSKGTASTTTKESQDDGGGTASGGVKLETCDGTMESSSSPITKACGTYITPTGTSVKLGPYGAAMDVNVGKGFENKDPMDQATCPGFVGLFMEDAKQSQQLLDDGPQPCTEDTPNAGNCINFQLYSVYHPANWPSGKVPIITWGNGTCAQPEGYGTLLRYVASYGFLVVAANSREVGTGAEQQKALDFVIAANDDSSSPYYHHLDTTKIGAMGHSQGSLGTALATQNDSRINAAILFNGGDTLTVPKSFLAISGELDVTGFTSTVMSTAVNAAMAPSAFLYYHNPSGNMADGIRGHLVLMLTPERVTEPTVAWWQMILNGDSKAKDEFVGSSCGLCGHSSDYDFGEKGL